MHARSFKRQRQSGNETFSTVLASNPYDPQPTVTFPTSPDFWGAQSSLTDLSGPGSIAPFSDSTSFLFSPFSGLTDPSFLVTTSEFATDPNMYDPEVQQEPNANGLELQLTWDPVPEGADFQDCHPSTSFQEISSAPSTTSALGDWNSHLNVLTDFSTYEGK
jgi:hypothetical protein